jgi:hypothetical protein
MLLAYWILGLSSLYTAHGQFTLEARRMRPSSNVVQLTCITNALLATANPDALFFLNGTELGIVGIRTVRFGEGVEIVVTRETEGMYTCGLSFDPRTSNNISIVGE